MPQDVLKNDSTLCSNSLELLVFFSSRKMLWRMVTRVLDPLPDVIFSAVSCVETLYQT